MIAIALIAAFAVGSYFAAEDRPGFRESLSAGLRFAAPMALPHKPPLLPQLARPAKKLPVGDGLGV